MALAVQAERPISIGTTHTIRSQVLGEERSFSLHLPEGADRRQSAPILYVLEGDEHFQHATATVEVLARAGRIPPLVVVGVHATQRDLTPTAMAQAPGSGGADRFLSFLTQELFPHVESRAATHPFRILAGHSYGGLLALHALERGQAPIQGFIALSPALFWDSGELLARLQQPLPPRGAGPVELFLALGAEEPDLSGPFLGLTRSLRQGAPEGLRWSHMILPGEDHGTSALRGMAEGLASVFAAWRVPELLVQQGNVAGLVNHVASAMARFGSAAAVAEPRMNDLGYRLLAEDRVADAIAVLQLNVEAYPDSANARDSLGEACERAGRLVEAAALYEAALQRGLATDDPSVGLYRQNLERVRARLEREGGGPPPPQAGAGARPLAPGESPPDFAAAFLHADPSLRLALEDGAVGLEAQPPDPARAAAPMILALLDQAGSAQEFARAVAAGFELAVAEDCLFTGYFTPECPARLERADGFEHPLHRRPAWLPHDATGPARAQIEDGALLSGEELAWLPDALTAYLVQVNGSARLDLPGGRTICVTHCGTNQRPYTSLGAELIAAGLSTPQRMDLPEIERLFSAHPGRVRELMRRNQRYVFFTERPCDGWPRGACGATLRPGASLAADPRFIPRGAVVLIDIDPGVAPAGAPPFPRLMVNHDEGGAILTARRADLYLGVGAEAGAVAGRLKAGGRMFLLRPRR
jgi:hypothetical protein